MKYYQYLRGENQGKVVVLDYVDDVTNSEMVLYHFSDGFKCNEDFIAPINDKNAFKEKKILVEVGADNPMNTWKFTKKSIKMEHKTAVADDGKSYEAADPYFIGKTGEQLNKEKESVNAIPPRQYYGNVEPIDQYRKSYKDYQLEQLRNKAKDEVEEDVKKQPKDDNINVVSEVPEDVEKYDKSLKDKEKDLEEMSQIGMPWGAMPLEEYRNERSENHNQEKQEEKQTQQPQQPKTFSKPLKYNDVIDVLMKTAKLNKAEISFTITLDLPDKSLIDVIKKNYSDEYVEDAFNYIIDTLDVSDINSAIKASLNEFYNNESDEPTINNDN